MIMLTKKQAREFMLLKHGLIDVYKFTGKQGVLDFIEQAGCIQYDPIDVCGKNAELVLQSRVKGFKKQMLYELLYDDRQLVDYFDKNLSIFNVSDWKYFARYRAENEQAGRSRDKVNEICESVKAIIRERGAVSSGDIDFNDTVSWYWSDTKLSRAALETLYFRGELVVHHKKGTIKYYSLAEDHIPKDILDAQDPFPDEHEHMKWRVLRRIGAVGLLWSKASDAWLNIRGLKSGERESIFAELVEESAIKELNVEDVKEKLYCLSADEKLLSEVMGNCALKARCEFIAPLDSILWDRKLIKRIFGFEYKWEIYTPEVERKYGYYTLPVLYGDRFIGRAELVNDRKSKKLLVKNIWYEDGTKCTKRISAALEKCILRFAAFNDCTEIERKDHR